jgi:CheY-like chemotaxis protein
MKLRKEAPYLLVIGSQDTEGCLKALANTDYACEEASTAADAIALAAQRRPSLIVLNLHRHVASGLDACRALVAADATRNVPILAIAGAPADQQFMIELSVKPCDMDTLDREIHRLVATIH